jgi:hypothetical protein
MTTPQPIASYARLIDEHVEIAARAGHLTAVTRSGDAAAIRTALDTLADALIDHLRTEDRDIHPRLMAATDSTTRMEAEAACRRYETLAADWIALIDHWTARRIAADTGGFAAVSAALIQRLHDRIREEDGLLYPAALATGQMALRG